MRVVGDADGWRCWHSCSFCWWRYLRAAFSLYISATSVLRAHCCTLLASLSLDRVRSRLVVLRGDVCFRERSRLKDSPRIGRG
jgi:hypothetical protein